jgi:uncharacterized membrane protein YphA (DoxX/SURF4 family)
MRRARLATIAGGLVHIAAVGAGAFSLDGYTLEGRRSPA